VQARAGASDTALAELDAEPGTDVRAAVARAVVTAGVDLLALSESSLSLEDVFLQLTTTDTAAGAFSAAEPHQEVTA
jgi:hypothetical protein